MLRFVPTLLWAGVVLSASHVHAQDVDPALIQARSAYEAAYQAGNAPAWATYVLDDALFTGDGGTLETKAERLPKVRRRSGPTPRVSEEKYRSYGNVAIHTWRHDLTNQAGESRAERRIEVWVRQDAQWKLASFQITVID